MVWYQLRYRYPRDRVYHTGGVVYKNLEDARKEANRLLAIRDDIRDNRVEIWAIPFYIGYLKSQSVDDGRLSDDMFVEAVVKRPKSNKSNRPKTNGFGLDFNLR